jgi:hypothetical protein
MKSSKESGQMSREPVINTGFWFLVAAKNRTTASCGAHPFDVFLLLRAKSRKITKNHHIVVNSQQFFGNYGFTLWLFK